MTNGEMTTTTNIKNWLSHPASIAPLVTLRVIVGAMLTGWESQNLAFLNLSKPA